MKEYRIALIGGAGFMGQAHSLGWALTSALTGSRGIAVRQVLVEATDEIAESAAERFGWIESSSNWREVINRPDIDIVDVVTPPNLHEEITLAALAAGKHVFVEKPVTNSAEQALAMRDAAEAANRANQVGFNYRHIPAITYAKKLIDDGAFGVPLQYRSSYLMHDFFTGGGTGWRAEKKTGGSGVVGDIGSHVLDIAEYLNGDIVRVVSTMRALEGDRSAWVPEKDRIAKDLVDQSAVWLAEFANGCIGTFAATGFSAGNNNHITFNYDGTLGAMRFDWNDREALEVAYVNDPPEQSGYKRFLSGPAHADVWYIVAGLGLGYVDGTALELQKFLNAIVDDQVAHPNFGEAAHVQQVVEAVEESAQSHAWVDVPRRTAKG